MVWGRPRDSGEGFQSKVIVRLRLNAVTGISQPIDFCPLSFWRLSYLGRKEVAGDSATER